MGNSGVFGGANGDMFEYAPMRMKGYNVDVPSIKMPSGYILRYPNLRLEQTDSRPKGQFVYDQYSKGSRPIPTTLYGGKLCENLVQGISFQLLMWQACRMSDAGIHIIGNVHDSWLAITDEDKGASTLEAMEFIMSSTPNWLPNFPIACEGEVGNDYTIA